MASIYWEPGMYQIIIMFVLALFFDEFKQMKLSNMTYYVRKFGIVILALIVCESTMGYMSLMALIGISFMFNSAVKKHKIVYVIMIITAAFMVITIWNSDVVQEKIDPKNLVRSSSLRTRLNDNYALWNMSIVSPLTGLGQGSKEFYRYGRMFGDRTASNGWLKLAAVYGWPFTMLFIFWVIKNLKRMKLGIPALFMFIPLFMSQSDEHYALFPIMFIYIYKYKDYS